MSLKNKTKHNDSLLEVRQWRPLGKDAVEKMPVSWNSRGLSQALMLPMLRLTLYTEFTLHMGCVCVLFREPQLLWDKRLGTSRTCLGRRKEWSLQKQKGKQNFFSLQSTMWGSLILEEKTTKEIQNLRKSYNNTTYWGMVKPEDNSKIQVSQVFFLNLPSRSHQP